MVPLLKITPIELGASGDLGEAYQHSPMIKLVAAAGYSQASELLAALLALPERFEKKRDIDTSTLNECP